MKKILTAAAAAYITLFSVTEAVALPQGECNFMAGVGAGTIVLRYEGVPYRDARRYAARYLGETLGSKEYQHIPYGDRQRWANTLAPFLTGMVTAAYDMNLSGSAISDANVFGELTYDICRGW